MKVVIIGAGPAGASAAAELRSTGAEVVVLEASETVGGRTKRIARDGFVIDSGAIFVMGSYDSTLRYLDESGLSDDMVRWKATAAIQDSSGRKHRVRYDQPWTFLRLAPLTWRDRVRCVKTIAPLLLGRRLGPLDPDDLAAADTGQTLEEWAVSRLGDRAYEYVVRPLMGPLTGADPKVISAAFAIALLTRFHQSTLTVPTGGMARITERLLVGAEVRTATPALGIDVDHNCVAVHTAADTVVADAVIVAADLHNTTELVQGITPSNVVTALRNVEPIPAYHVVFGDSDLS